MQSTNFYSYSYIYLRSGSLVLMQGFSGIVVIICLLLLFIVHKLIASTITSTVNGDLGPEVEFIITVHSQWDWLSCVPLYLVI